MAAISSTSSPAVAASSSSALPPSSTSGCSTVKLATDEVVLDGSMLQIGGQLMRNGAAFAALLNRSIHITKIRNSTGLKPEDVTGLRLVATMFGGRMAGAEAGSHDVHYTPAADLQPYPNDDTWWTDTGAVGTHCMAIQLVIPLLTFIYPSRVPIDGIRLRGGTNVKGAPLIDYAITCITPMLKRLFGLRVNIDVNKRGWSPKGDGEFHVSVSNPSATIRGFDASRRGAIERITVLCIVAGSVRSDATAIGQAMADAAVAYIHSKLPADTRVDVDIRTESAGADVTGACILVSATSVNGYVLAQHSVMSGDMKAADVGVDAATRLVTDVKYGGCVDDYMQDQIILFMALAHGRSLLRSGPLTLHTKTAIHWAQVMTGARFDVRPLLPFEYENKGEETYMIECHGCGYQSRFFKEAPPTSTTASSSGELIVAVGSKNAAKLKSVRSVFQRLFPSQPLTVLGAPVESGVSAQPKSASETLQGAINRARAALAAVPTATYGIGLEGGIEPMPRLLTDDDDIVAMIPQGPASDHDWFGSGWIVAVHRDGRTGVGSAARYHLATKLVKPLFMGHELCEVVDAVSGRTDVRSDQGIEGMLSDGHVPRDAAYEHGLIFAMSPFIARASFWDANLVFPSDTSAVASMAARR